jgi:hypothetical protein
MWLCPPVRTHVRQPEPGSHLRPAWRPGRALRPEVAAGAGHLRPGAGRGCQLWPGPGAAREDPHRTARPDEFRRLHAAAELAERAPRARPADRQPPVPASRGVLSGQRGACVPAGLTRGRGHRVHRLAGGGLPGGDAAPLRRGGPVAARAGESIPGASQSPPRACLPPPGAVTAVAIRHPGRPAGSPRPDSSRARPVPATPSAGN